MSPKPKSATRSMTTYKTLCTNRIRDVNDAVKEYTGKTLALQQSGCLEDIRDKLVEQEDRMTQSYEQFALEEHEEIDAATTIYQETMTLVTVATGDIQAMIGQAYDKLQANQSQNPINTNAGEVARGATGGSHAPKPKPAKIDDTLKPKGKLTNEMSLLEATEWIKEYRAFMAHNATNLGHHEAKVPRELLEVNIDPTMKLKLRSKAKPDTSINDCLNILEKVYLLKYLAWYQRCEYFQSVQAEVETVEDWWARKSQLEEYCNLADIKPKDLRILELIMGVRSPGL